MRGAKRSEHRSTLEAAGERWYGAPEAAPEARGGSHENRIRTMEARMIAPTVMGRSVMRGPAGGEGIGERAGRLGAVKPGKDWAVSRRGYGMGVKSEKHVYRVRGLGRYRLVAAVGFVLFVVIYGGLLVILSGKQHHLSIPVRAVWIGVMLVGLFGFLAALVAGILMQTKLVLAPEGLSLRFMGMGNGAPWASFDRVDHVPIHGLYHEVDVLMLKVPMSGFGSKSAFRSGKRQHSV